MQFGRQWVEGLISFSQLSQDEFDHGDLELKVVEIDLQPGIVLRRFSAEGDFTIDEVVQCWLNTILIDGEIPLVGGVLLVDARTVTGLMDGRDGVRVIQVNVDHFSSRWKNNNPFDNLIVTQIHNPRCNVFVPKT